MLTPSPPRSPNSEPRTRRQTADRWLAPIVAALAMMTAAGLLYAVTSYVVQP